MNFNNNNKHEIKTKFRFIDNEIQGSTKGEKGGEGPVGSWDFQGLSRGCGGKRLWIACVLMWLCMPGT